MRRVLHVPATDVMVGDLISFRYPYIPLQYMGESKIVYMERDPSDGDIHIKFEDDRFSAYFHPGDQLVILQEV